MLRRARGMTLVELLVVMAIAAIGTKLAAPGIAQLLANYKVRGVAEAIVSGLNFARGEAARRNSPVSFALATDGGWTIQQVSTSSTLLSRSAADLAGATVASSSSATSVTFVATGLVQSGTQMTQVNISSPASNTQTRRINIFGGGLIRMCDPGVTTASDPRKC
ncbi:GspH/FimT family pseudopilin [Ramlibacter sp.]|uniref:GspH/FimT family pseudopilin n=1 Tax=Ramlibacter sp. TaxID=1917967 RepID=UPI00181D4529|nr:GspH/FimT family pseudopilin [Ramlibacter sp.]MBA2674663.1 GspH/FimT family pseudopilin [Ramlibacter sp.]